MKSLQELFMEKPELEVKKLVSAAIYPEKFVKMKQTLEQKK